MDEDSSALAIQLQIQDSQELPAQINGKGKRKAEEMSDEQLAFSLYQNDLKRRATIIGDRTLTKSITRACRIDEAIITTVQTQEQVATSDLESACRLGGICQPAPIAPSKQTSTPEAAGDEAMNNPSANSVELPVSAPRVEPRNPTPDIDEHNCESSSQDASRTISADTRRQCIACQEQIARDSIVCAPCTHEYCRSCLIMLFRAALTDEALFPLRCCRQLITPLLDEVRPLIPQDLVCEYEKKKVEFETLDRTYCDDQRCMAFILPGDGENERVKCEECGKETCVMCKAAAHEGDCLDDMALQQVLDMAEENGWQRCTACGRIVELDFGCNHITYVLRICSLREIPLTFSRCCCGAEFCYDCGEEWKTCDCPQWHEPRLYAREEQAVAEQQPEADADYMEIQDDEAAILNLQNECPHHEWNLACGEYRCEECFELMHRFIHYCDECNLLVCRQCLLDMP